VSGATFNALGAMVSKFSSFIAQLVLGWLLSDGDFGIYAMCVSVMTFAFFADGGLWKQLLARGAEYDRIAQPILKLQIAFGVATAVLLIAFAPVVARLYFQEQAIVPLLWLIAITYLLNAFTTVRRTKLLIDLRFKASAGVITASGVIRQFSSVIFALLGFGPLSFILPMVVASLFELVAMWRLVGPVPKGEPLTREFAKPLLRSGAWIMLTVLGVGLSNRVELFIAGGSIDAKLLGLYYWGVSIAASTLVPVTSAVAGTFAAVFVKLAHDKARQAQAVERTMSAITLVLAPISMCLALAAPVLVDLMWNGKWNAAIPITQIAYISLPITVILSLSIMLYESHQRFRSGALLQLMDGGLAAVAACAIFIRGNIVDLAAANLVRIAVSSTITCLIISRFLEVPFVRVYAKPLRPLMLAVGTAGIFYVASGFVSPAHRPWVLFGGAFVLPIIYLGLAWWVMRERVREVYAAGMDMLRRRRRSVPEPPTMQTPD
jgi:O-antigen/teichoic acid export membrane protein